MAGQRKRNPNGAGTITKRKFAYGKTWAECDAKRGTGTPWSTLSSSSRHLRARVPSGWRT